MDRQNIAEKVQELTDVELATLLCLVAGQHCIVQTEEEGLDALEQELQLVREFLLCRGVLLTPT